MVTYHPGCMSFTLYMRSLKQNSTFMFIFSPNKVLTAARIIEYCSRMVLNSHLVIPWSPIGISSIQCSQWKQDLLCISIPLNQGRGMAVRPRLNIFTNELNRTLTRKNWRYITKPGSPLYTMKLSCFCAVVFHLNGFPFLSPSLN